MVRLFIGAHLLFIFPKGVELDMGKKEDPVNAGGGNLAPIIAAAAAILPLVRPAADAACDFAERTIEERKKLVSVPPLYAKGYAVSYSQAVEILEGCGLKATLVKTVLADVDPGYRNCFESQVIKTEPKAKKKVVSGTVVKVKCITQEVIDASQQKFDKLEQHRLDQRERTKNTLSNAIDTVKHGAVKFAALSHANKNKEETDE